MIEKIEKYYCDICGTEMDKQTYLHPGTSETDSTRILPIHVERWYSGKYELRFCNKCEVKIYETIKSLNPKKEIPLGEKIS